LPEDNEEDEVFSDAKEPSSVATRRSSSSGSSSDIVSSASLLASPYKANLTQRERWHLNFFFSQTSSQCSVFYGDDFWQRVLPQFSESEPEIRHAVIAVGALHRNFASNQTDNHFPIMQCNRAIATLRRRLDGDKDGRPPPHMETILITCILFVSFAFLSGDAPTACRLLRGGFKLMEEWKKSSPTQSDSAIKALLPKIFSRMQINSLTCGNPDVSVSSETLLPYSRSLSDPIDSMETASGLLFDICQVVLQGRYSVHSAEGYNMLSVLNKLQTWEAQCHAFLQSRTDHVSLKELSTLTMLRMWSDTIYILVAAEAMESRLESRYDAFLAHFHRAIAHAKKLLSTDSLRQVLPTFQIEPGIVPPLFLCAFKCRDWDLRQDVIAMLNGWQCQEGYWSSVGAVKCLEQISLVETQGLAPGEVIPEKQRIVAARVSYLTRANTWRFAYRLSQSEKRGWQSVLVTG
jgi:Fungal specific transcription factor domain